MDAAGLLGITIGGDTGNAGICLFLHPEYVE